MADFDPAAFENAVIEDMRAHHGQVTSGPLAGHPLLILTSTGAKSGEPRRAVLTYTMDNGAYVVTLTVTDKDGGTGTSSRTVRVFNVAPTVGINGAPDTSPEDLAWITPRRRWQPIGCFSQPLLLKNPSAALPRSYIFCTRLGPGDPFGQFATRFRSDPAWQFFEIDASHSPNVTAPEELVRILDRIAK